QSRDGLPEGRQSCALDLFNRTFADDERALPVVAAIDHHQDAPGIEAAHGLVGVARFLRETEPQHVHRRAEIIDRKPGALAHRRVPAVATDRQLGTDLERAIRRRGAYNRDAAAVLDQIGGLGAHARLDRRISTLTLAEEVANV